MNILEYHAKEIKIKLESLSKYNLRRAMRNTWEDIYRHQDSTNSENAIYSKAHNEKAVRK